MTGNPKVRLGTKCASITSKCSQSASATRWDSSASRAKSADSRLGAIIGSRDTSAESRWVAQPTRRPRLPATARSPDRFLFRTEPAGGRGVSYAAAMTGTGQSADPVRPRPAVGLPRRHVRVLLASTLALAAVGWPFGQLMESFPWPMLGGGIGVGLSAGWHAWRDRARWP